MLFRAEIIDRKVLLLQCHHTTNQSVNKFLLDYLCTLKLMTDQ